ncbi:BnaA09g15670D [Brassica napus]|uniref:BnaA09g15670D protein n=1 Tax=Brassica napus TaxID=3708 RepID=A0A078ITH8_BRANA|nr:BnaA09g15670D [Brassica napus]
MNFFASLLLALTVRFLFSPFWRYRYSYADTGNTKTTDKGAWAFPYGITYPGKPSGRFSDGHISTDFFRIKLPVTHSKKDDVDKTRLQYGMSFAYGGTGVFDTKATYPNMTGQITLFEQLLGNVYSPSDLSSSVALVSVAGNDYLNFLSTRHSLDAILSLITQVVNQIEVNLRRIHSLGIKKIAVPSLQPLGYIPYFAKGFPFIKDAVNFLVGHHNDLLHEVVAKLNNETNHSAFTIIDYNNAFLTVINNKGEIPDILLFETPFIECFQIDVNEFKNSTLCDDPRSAFFWDGLHPTQEGWKSVYTVLRKNITAALT